MLLISLKILLSSPTLQVALRVHGSQTLSPLDHDLIKSRSQAHEELAQLRQQLWLGSECADGLGRRSCIHLVDVQGL